MPSSPSDLDRDATPLVRWAGGKRRLLGVLAAAAPARPGGYVEPMAGGAALYLALAATGRADPTRSVLGDRNPALVALYRHVAADVDGLVAELRRLDGELARERRSGGDGGAHYYRVRGQLNARLRDGAADSGGLDASDAARVLYLNRTGFNGLWRVNRRGELNVPHGKLADPTICDETRLRCVAALLPPPERIVSGDYTAATQLASPGDLVYFDPPYVPHTPTASFATYTRGGFGLDEHARLVAHARDLASRGVDVMLSNADDVAGVARDVVLGGGGVGPWHVLQVRAPRSVAARGDRRVHVPELLAVSWPVSRASDPGRLAALGACHVGSRGDAGGWDRALPPAGPTPARTAA